MTWPPLLTTSKDLHRGLKLGVRDRGYLSEVCTEPPVITPVHLSALIEVIFIREEPKHVRLLRVLQLAKQELLSDNTILSCLVRLKLLCPHHAVLMS